MHNLIKTYLDPVPEIRLWVARQALMSPWAEPFHFNRLLDCAELLMFGARIRADSTMERASQFFRTALWNVLQRHKETNKLGATGEELRAISAMIQISTDFWSRQSSSNRKKAEQALAVYRKKLKEAA